VNLIGKSAPRTNVARSDVEKTPELECALFRIYSLLGNHVESEFSRLLKKHTGIVEAASEADSIRQWGLERSPLSSPLKFSEAMGGLKIIAMEDGNACKAISKNELHSFDKIWTVDSRLIKNIESICGTLGIDHSTEKVIKDLGKGIKPSIPLPRIIGTSKDPMSKLEITKIRISPEERTQRIDLCWEKHKPGRWIRIEKELIDRSDLKNYYPTFLITMDKEISLESPNYDLARW
jgi:hypothetical protein